MIVSESMPSTRSIPAIKSLGVGGWVFARRFDPTCWLEVTALFSMTRQAAGVVDLINMESKQMSTVLVRMSGMLSGKMTPLVRAIKLHEELWILLMSDGEINAAHKGVNPHGLVVRRGGISRVAHEHMEHREHGKFILVRASGE
jgi:hypothetical protein